MSYVNLIPSIVEYTNRFRELDSVDFKIIKGMYDLDVRNVSKLSRLFKIPQQTLSRRVNRFDAKDVVRFRALVDEAKLGLKNFLVIAPCKFGTEKVSSRAMTCFPLWRYLAIVDGGVHGSYVRYSMPSDRELDLRVFLDLLVKRELISGYELFHMARPNYPLLNLDFYKVKRGTPIFDWDKWVEDLDSFAEESLVDPVDYHRANFDLYDLLILRCLEINARMKLRNVAKQIAQILGEKDYGRLIPLVSRRLKRNIIPQKIIRGYRVYIFPTAGQNVLSLIFHLSFKVTSIMTKFAAGLKCIPYNVTYQKVLERNELFVHFYIPAYEYSRMRKALVKLGEIGNAKMVHFFLGDLTNATWDNVEIYQMYRDNAWNFSFGNAVEMLDKVLSMNN